MDRSEFSELSELSKLSIFSGMTREELEEALSALHPRAETYARNQSILHAGRQVDDIYVVLSGSGRMEFLDTLGSRSIPAFRMAGQVFGLVPGILGNNTVVSAVANEDCRLLLLSVSGLSVPRPYWRPWLYQVTRNLLEAACRQCMKFSGRDMLLAPKRARDRLIAFLTQLYREKGTMDFFVPFDQQQLADYLNLDRSVVSKELNKLKREGLLWFNRNHFILQPGTEITGGAEGAEKK